MTSLATIPKEVLERIAMECTTLDRHPTTTSGTPPTHASPTVVAVLAELPLGPPTGLVPLLLTCKTIYGNLSFKNNSALYASIFRERFDCSAPRRRLGARAGRSRALADQLKIYSQCLRRTRRRVQAADSREWVVPPWTLSGSNNVEEEDWRRPEVLEADLWTMCLMMLECDGRNEAQLRYYAHAHDFVDRYVRERLWDGRAENRGWPVENTRNSLVMWMMWMMCGAETLRNESHERRQQVIHLIFPYVVLGFRYAMFYVPDNHFTIPLRAGLSGEQIETSMPTAHGIWPIYRQANTQNTNFAQPVTGGGAPPGLPTPPSPDSAEVNSSLTQILTHFGQALYLTPPPLAPFAALLYFARQEQEPIQVPEHLPNTRAEADALGWPRPCETKADYAELAAFPHARVPKAGAKLVLRVNGGASAGGEEWELPDWNWRASLTPLERRIEDGTGGFGDAYLHFNPFSGTFTGLEEPQGRSAMWECDWARINTCGEPFYLQPSLARQTYKPGCLDGLWQGRQLVPTSSQYLNLLTSTHAPEDLRDHRLFCSSRAIVVRFREHHLLDGDPANAPSHRTRWSSGRSRDSPSTVSSRENRSSPHSLSKEDDETSSIEEEDDPFATIPAGGPRDPADPDFGFDEGVRNGWLPYCRMRKSENAVHIVDTQGASDLQEYRYETHVPGVAPTIPHTPHRCAVCRREREEEKALAERNEDVEMEDDTEGALGVEELEESRGGIVGLSDAERSRLVEDGFKAAGMEDFDMSDETDDDVDDVDMVSTASSSVEDWAGWKRPCRGIRDIIVTGSVLPRHAAAWLDCEYYGRVRPYDGLIALVRIQRLFPGQPTYTPPNPHGAQTQAPPLQQYAPAHPHSTQPFPNTYSHLLGLPNADGGPIGLWVFRGQMVGGQNLVGRWRAMTQDVGTPPWEGPFTLSRRPEDA